MHFFKPKDGSPPLKMVSQQSKGSTAKSKETSSPILDSEESFFDRSPLMRKPLAKVFMTLFFLYLFLAGVKLLESSFGLMGGGFAQSLFKVTSNPISGLFVGIITTALIQSSSVTTSIVVGLVSSGTLNIEQAIPFIMGANIGTSVTNTLVSLAHVNNSEQFKKSFAAATVHDFFNFLTVLALLPLEIMFGILQKVSVATAEFLSGGASVGESLSFNGPIKAMIQPVLNLFNAIVTGLFGLSGTWAGVMLAVCAAILIIFTLAMIVKIMGSVVKTKAASRINEVLSSPALALIFGVVVTFLVQSSSITTSLLVPLAGSGLLTLEAVYPITLGANIGTTGTALIASLTGNIAGFTIALVHFYFNLLGTFIWYFTPVLKKFPPFCAVTLANICSKRKVLGICYVVGIFFVLPFLLIFFT